MAEWRRWLLYPALVSLGLGMLASCAEEPPPPPPKVAVAPVLPPPPPPRPHRVLQHPSHKPAPPPEPESPVPESGDTAAAIVEPDAATHPPAPAPVPRSQELIGLDQTAVKRLFGAAAEQSDQPPATVWRYRSATCGLDFYFYLDLRSGQMRTLHYTFNGDAADPAGRQNCLKSLVVTRGT
jgi:outer membrane biosynthesis protein TonB